MGWLRLSTRRDVKLQRNRNSVSVFASDRHEMSFSTCTTFVLFFVAVLVANAYPFAAKDCSRQQLKLYVYDLHQKFNFGLFGQQNLSSLPHSPEADIGFKYTRKEDGRPSGRGFEHSGEYFLLMDLLVSVSNKVPRFLCRSLHTIFNWNTKRNK